MNDQTRRPVPSPAQQQTETRQRRSAVEATAAPTDNLPAIREPSPQQAQPPRQPMSAISEPKVYSPKIAKAILAVSAEMGAVTKDGVNKFHNYNYQKWDDILDRVSVLLVKHSLIIIPSEVEKTLFEGGKMVTITYEFTIVNADGDVWPDRPRWTAEARMVDAKGVADDKAINKVHTAAEKYFLIHLFKIRTGDPDDDADAGGGDKKKPAAGKPAGKAPKAPVPGPNGKIAPHEVSRGEDGADGYAARFIGFLDKAETALELDSWFDINKASLDLLYEKFPDEYRLIEAADVRRKKELTTVTKPSPQPAQTATKSNDDIPSHFGARDPADAEEEHEEEHEEDHAAEAVAEAEQETREAAGRAEPRAQFRDKAPTGAIDIPVWLNKLTADCAKAKSGDDLVEIQNKSVLPMKGAIPDESYKAAMKIVMDRFESM